MLRAPEVDTVVQVGSYESGVEGESFSCSKVIINYNETCYQGFRGGEIILHISKNLQNPSTRGTEILDLYSEVQKQQIT